ncbi:MAG: DMT family transporter [Bacteroidota bacterium]|nr:DMT family transporter [Bacteroidota bacterium]
MKLSKNALTGYVAVLISAILFSSKGVVIKLAYLEKIDTLTLLTFRMLFALPFFIGTTLYTNYKNKIEPISKSDIAKLIVLAFLGYYLSPLLDFIGLQYVPAGIERLILFIYPTIVVILSMIIFKKPITKTMVIALILTYSGLVFVLSFDIPSQSMDFTFGAILILLCAFTFAIYLVYSEGLIKIHGSTNFTSYIMIVSAIFFIIHYLIQNQSITALFNYSNKVYLICAILAFFCTVIPSYLMSYGIKIVGSGNTAIAGTLGPVWTFFLASILLGDKINFYDVIGTILVISGVLILTLKK